ASLLTACCASRGLAECDDAGSKTERRVERLGLLLQILATGFASRAEGLANVGEVAERDGGLLSDPSPCRGNRLGGPRFRSRTNNPCEGRKPQPLMRCGANERHAVG